MEQVLAAVILLYENLKKYIYFWFFKIFLSFILCNFLVWTLILQFFLLFAHSGGIKDIWMVEISEYLIYNILLKRTYQEVWSFTNTIGLYIIFPYLFQIKETKLVPNLKLVPSVKELAHTDLGSQFLLELIVILCMMKDCLGKADQTKWLM